MTRFCLLLTAVAVALKFWFTSSAVAGVPGTKVLGMFRSARHAQNNAMKICHEPLPSKLRRHLSNFAACSVARRRAVRDPGKEVRIICVRRIDKASLVATHPAASQVWTPKQQTVRRPQDDALANPHV